MKISPLQVGLIAFIIILVFVAILVFSGALPGIRPYGQSEAADLIMWGSIPDANLAKPIADTEKSLGNITIKYVEKTSESLENEFLNALASGAGPDIVILPSDLVLKHRDKLFSIESAVSERDFQDAFADASSILNIQGKIYGLPLVIDPLLLYWNRDLFSSSALARSPQFWDEFLTDSQRLTKVDAARNIVQSGAALGLYANISHPKEILSLLAMQAGDPLVSNQTLKTSFGQRPENQISPMENSLRFYTDFSNSSKASYSWAPSLPLDIQMFSRGDLAMYFGFASEFRWIQNSNPHLNFDVAGVPQIRGSKTQIAYGRLNFLAIPKSSSKAKSALSAAMTLSSDAKMSEISQATNLPPVRRALLSREPADPVKATFWREAIKSRSWLDADPVITSSIFNDMIRSVYSGAKTTENAVRDAKIKFEALY